MKNGYILNFSSNNYDLKLAVSLNIMLNSMLPLDISTVGDVVVAITIE